MTTFKQIYQDTYAYRDIAAKMVQLIDDLNLENNKHRLQNVFWRRRNFYIKNNIEPLQNILNLIMKTSTQNLEHQALLQKLKTQIELERKEIQDEYSMDIKEAKKNLNLAQERRKKLMSLSEEIDNSSQDDFAQSWIAFCRINELRTGIRDVLTAFSNDKTKQLIEEYEREFTSNVKKAQDYLSELQSDLKEEMHDISLKYRSKKAEIVDIPSKNVRKYDYESVKDLYNKLNILKETMGSLNSLKIFESKLDDISKLIQESNKLIDECNIDAAYLPSCPESINTNNLEACYEALKKCVEDSRDLYQQAKMRPVIADIRRISDAVNRRYGYLCFTRRKNDLITHTNIGLRWFNTHEWQISGQRWERKAGNHHGYTKVTPLFSPIPTIN